MKKFLIPVIALAMFASCSKDGGNDYEGGNGNGDGQGPEELSQIVMDMNVRSSRSSIESNGSGVITNTGMTSLPIAFVRPADGTGAVWTNVGTATPTDGKTKGIVEATINVPAMTVDFTHPQYYNLTAANSSYFVGYYPKNPTLATDASDYTTAEWAIDGKTDVLVSNLVSGTKANIASNTTLKPVFGHMLTRIKFEIVGAAGANLGRVQAYWGNVNDIKIKATNNAIKVTFDGTPTVAGSGAANIDTYSALETDAAVAPKAIAANAATGTSPAFFSEALVYPGLTTYTATVTTAAGHVVDVPVTFAGNVAASAGQAHLVTLSFSLNEIEVDNVQVTAWAPGAAGAGTVQ